VPQGRSTKCFYQVSEFSDKDILKVTSMMPGGRVNPRQMKAMMKRMGITQEDIADVEEVVIRTRTKEIVFKDAEVSAMTVQGQKTFQVVGTPQERPRSTTEQPSEEGGISEEDVKLVMSQTGCSAAQARKALEETDGAPAEAILKIMASR
jgi:nascent polypeptide-associated complex subunit alpha